MSKNIKKTRETKVVDSWQKSDNSALKTTISIVLIGKNQLFFKISKLCTLLEICDLYNI